MVVTELHYVVFVIAIDSAVLYSVTVRRHEPAVEQVKAGLQQQLCSWTSAQFTRVRWNRRLWHRQSTLRNGGQHYLHDVAPVVQRCPCGRAASSNQGDHTLDPGNVLKGQGTVDLTSRHQAQLRSRHLRLELDGAAFMTLLGALINNVRNGLRIHSIRKQLAVDRWQGLSQARRAMCRATKFQRSWRS